MHWKLLVTLGAIAVAGLCWLVTSYQPEIPPAKLLAAAQRSLLEEDYPQAEALALAYLEHFPHSLSARLLAGEAATHQGQFARAAKHYEALPWDQSAGLVGHLAEADLYRQLGALSQAVVTLRKVLKNEPRSVTAHERLSLILNLSGCRSQAIPHLLFLVQSGQATQQHLSFLANPNKLVHHEEFLAQCLAQRPDDPLVQLAQVQILRQQGDRKTARELLAQIVRTHPELVEAQIQLGSELLDERDSSLFVPWRKSLPPEAESHPDLWMICGRWLQIQGQIEGAIRCFWETTRRNPNHQAANYQLYQLLSQQHHPGAETFLKRSRDLQELINRLEQLELKSTSANHLKSISEVCESLGRLWEALAWLVEVRKRTGATRELEDQIRAIRRRFSEDSPQTLPSHQPGVLVDLSTFPLPTWEAGTGELSPPDESPPSVITFSEDSQEAGVDFSYFNGETPDARGKRMFAFTGGGVGVFDLDVDGWPDLYFTQGNRWPVDEATSDYEDQCFRNLGDGRFQRVTESGLGDRGFGQGVAVGDYNNDGFPDLFIGNIGRNRLYENNGDGTFHPVPDFPGGHAWTTSVAIVDLNRDGHPDFFEVNYLQGEEVFTRVCQYAGQAVACHPTAFDPAPDVLIANRGDDTFLDVSNHLSNHPGNGLGILAADFHQSGEIDVFVANDAVPNFYYRNASTPDRWELTEEAGIRGLAVDLDGKPQACMGVAADDATGDGRLDLFVTNFIYESNTLYVNEETHFEDRTQTLKLRHPSYALLGFGTQYLDADLDGDADILVTNGHVDDFTHANIPYRMRPQCFQNLSNRLFAELAAPQLGAFFQKEQLGRGMALIDWNRDGKEEAVISRLDTPAALLTNQTPQAGRYIAVRLVGVSSSRDAVGSIVTVESSNGIRTRQLTAGCGYLASNQQQLIVGLGHADSIEKLSVRWPSGRKQTFFGIPANQSILLVEDQDRWLPCP